jgi:large subunit ribosomal protein LP0
LEKIQFLKKFSNIKKKKNPSLESLLPYLSGNVGLIFTKIEPSEVKKILSENKIPAPAKIGQVAQCDVIIPSGPTNLPPDGTSFFQALNISTKIEKGQIEIEKPIKIITKGQNVGNSEFELLKKLNIVPFSYEIQIILIYDNKFSYDPVVLEISEENIIETIESVYGSISSVSKVICYPTLDSLKFTLKKTIANIYTVCRFLDIDIKIKSSAINKEEYYEKTLNNDILENVDEISKTSVEIKSEENEDFGFGLFD